MGHARPMSYPRATQALLMSYPWAHCEINLGDYYSLVGYTGAIIGYSWAIATTSWATDGRPMGKIGVSTTDLRTTHGLLVDDP